MKINVDNIHYVVEMSADEFTILNDELDYTIVAEKLEKAGAFNIDYDRHFGEHISFSCVPSIKPETIVAKLKSLINMENL